MEICRFAESVNTPHESCSYYCGLHGYEMGLELEHWCEACEEYAAELSDGHGRKSSPRQRIPCAVCRFLPTCRFRRQNHASCPFFSQK